MEIFKSVEMFSDTYFFCMQATLYPVLEISFHPLASGGVENVELAGSLS